MDQELAQKIIKEISRFSAKRYAITDIHGIVLAKTPNFSLAHDPLEIKSKRSFPISYDNQRIGFLYIDENLATVKDIGNIIKSMTDLIVHQSFFAIALTRDEKRLDNLIFDFFKTDKNETGDLERTLRGYSLSFKEHRLAIILEISQNNYLANETVSYTQEREQKIAHIKRELSFLFNSFYTNHRNNIVSYLGGNTFLVLKDMGSDPEKYEDAFKKTLPTLFSNLKSELRTEITMGIGEYKPGLNGLKESFNESETALKFGRQNWGANHLYHFDSFGVVAPLFSGANDENVNVSQKLVRDLKNHPDLFKTLVTYFELDISLSKTAKRLKIHRNTLIYRLEKIADITNLDPRIFNDAFQLYLALVLNRYSGVKNGN